MRFLTIDLGLLTPAESRDPANALLRAAWCAALDEARVPLLELLIDADEAFLGGDGVSSESARLGAHAVGRVAGA